MINDLVFVSPESEGISSDDILEFIKLIEYYKINLHSFLIARNGKIIVEGYFKPFCKDFAHRIYSSSKTFVALSVGLLLTEGKISLDDKIVDLLRSYIEEDPPLWLREATVYDCLTMSLPQAGNNAPAEDPDRWIYNALNDVKLIRPAGTGFLYSGGAELLAAAVKEITGKEFLDYLRPVFDKIGVSENVTCVKNVEGISWGGSGVIITLRDFAKVGELVLNKGKTANNEQLIDRGFMESMTKKQVSNLTANNYFPLRSCGYGYLTWITPEATAFRGMGLQQCYAFHEKGLLFVCNGDTQSSFDTQDNTVYLFVKHLIYDRIGEKKCAGESYLALKEKLLDLNPPMYGDAHSELENEINGKTYVMNENPFGWKYFRFDFKGNDGTLTYENARGKKIISFGMGTVAPSKFPETHYYGMKRDEPSGKCQRCVAFLDFVETKKLLLRVYIIDTSFGNVFMQFGFKGREVGVEMNKRAEFFLDDYQGFGSGYLE